tara:strand:- start:1834 stop:10626 length:8793 start_codon:yes stop_codon:yes gene_type:complete
MFHHFSLAADKKQTMKALIKSIILVAACFGTMHAQQITSVAPNNGLAGSQVTITGSGFSTTASENQVYFGKSKASVISVNAAGTELVVNTPTNPTFPARISTLNTSTDKWITSDVRFRFTYGAKINPTTRNIQEQYQTEKSTSLVTDVGRTAFGYNKGRKLVSGNFAGDASTDIFLLSDDKVQQNNFGQTENGSHSLLENENNIFKVTKDGEGFSETKSTEIANRTSETVNDIPYLEIRQSGMLSVDLNNDGQDEMIIYGSRFLKHYVSTLMYNGHPAFSVYEFADPSSSGTVTAQTITNRSMYTITANGGKDYSTNLSGNTTKRVVENAGDQLLVQTSVLEMKAADVDSDGDMDLIALLSWPLIREEQNTNVRPDRYQIYIFENTTAAGANIFTFGSSTYHNVADQPSGSTIIPAEAYGTPNDENFDADRGNFLGPDHVISLDNSAFTDYDINRWISDFEVADMDGDGDFDLVVKGIENLATTTINSLDTTVSNTGNAADFGMKWLYDATITVGTGIKAPSNADNGFLSWFKNNSSTSTISFSSESVIDDDMNNNGKYDWGGIDVNDVDNDGDMDIIVSTPDNTTTTTATPDVAIYYQTGAQSFGSPVVLDGPTTPTFTPNTASQGYVVSELLCEDFNGDGLFDIAITNSNLGDFYVYMRSPGTAGTASSHFNLQKFNYSPSFGKVIGLELADYSNDGKPDLVMITNTISGSTIQSKIRYFKNNNGEPTVLTSGQFSVFSKCLNDPSDAQSFTVGGININKNEGHEVTVTVTDKFEIALDNATFGASVSIVPDVYGDVAPTEVYVRAKTTTNDLAFQGTFTATSNAASAIEFDLVGERGIPVPGVVTPAYQYVNTTNTPSTPPGTTPAATSAPVAITVAGHKGTVQWQKSTDNATWSDISTNGTAASYTLPTADIEGEGIVYLRAKISRCNVDDYTEVVTVVENLGTPAPPALTSSNGTSISGMFDASLSTSLVLKDANGNTLASCSNLTNGSCSGFSFTSGVFTYNFSPALSNGDVVYALAESILAGSTVTSEQSNHITVDATAPSAPTVDATNGYAITGTAEAGSTVTFTYTSGGVSVISTTEADASGNYTYYPATTLADGTSISVTSTDGSGNASASTTVTTDAVTPTITSTYTDVDGDALGNATTLKGTTEANATIVATLSDGTEITETADAQGNYEFDLSNYSISDGDFIYVEASDAAGNTSDIVTHTIDAAAPSSATVELSNGQSITGTAEANTTAIITYTDGNGTAVSERVTVDQDGDYTYTPTTAIPHNTVVYVVVEDRAANTSGVETVTVDNVAPTVTAEFEDANGGAIASATEISGETEPNTVIYFYDGSGNQLMDPNGGPRTVTSESNGDFTVNTSSWNLSNGDVVSVRANDATGNIGTLDYTIDSNPPASPNVTNVSGFVRNTVSGTTEAGATVTFSYGNTVTLVADANGDFSYTFNPNVYVAHNTTINVTSTDVLGNESSATTVTMDTEAPSITPDHVDGNGDAICNASSVTGSTDANTDVELIIEDYPTSGTSTTLTTTSNNDGDFSFDISSYNLDDNSLKVVVKDDVDNSTEKLYSIDDTRPVASIHASDGSVFKGELDGPGYSVSISYGNSATTQAANITGSTFEWTPSSSLGLSPGDEITYTVTDAVGNAKIYKIELQSTVSIHCRPAHTAGIDLGKLKVLGSDLSELVVYEDNKQGNGSYLLGPVYNDLTTIDTIMIDHDELAKIQIQFANIGSPSLHHYNIWVDTDQSGEFDSDEDIGAQSKYLGNFADEELYAWSTPGPFDALTDGEMYVMRIGLSTTQDGVTDPCGDANETAYFVDLKFVVLNCEEIPTSLTATENATGTEINVDFNHVESSIDYAVLVAEAAPNFGGSFDDPFASTVAEWLTENNVTPTYTNESSTSSSSPYAYSTSKAVDWEGASIAPGRTYQVAVGKRCSNSTAWTTLGFSMLTTTYPNPPSWAKTDLEITSHPSYTQTYEDLDVGGLIINSPENSLNVPVGASVIAKSTVKDVNGFAVTPNRFHYIDVNALFSSGANPVVASLESVKATNFGVPSLTVSGLGTSPNEIVHSFSRTTSGSLWLSNTFEYMPGVPMDAVMIGKVANAIEIRWWDSPEWNTNMDGFTGCVPNETVTIDSDGTPYTATADPSGNVSLTDFSPIITLDDLNGLVNGYYTVNQSWTVGGTQHTHSSPTISVLSGLSINAGSNGVTGTAAPGATVTLTIGDETFTTTADATTGIYDFSGTTSSSTAPSTGIDFNTLVPFTATTAYTINQSLAGYTAAADVTGSILATTTDIAVPTIGGALALSGSSTTVVGTAEAGAQVYLYDEDGNQLFDANGDPITTTADDQGAYSITVDLSAAQTSTGSNTFASAYTSPYTGAVIQVGSTDTDGNTAPLSAAFVNPSVYTSSGTWTDASGTPISAPSTSGAATSSSPVIRYESNATLPSGITGLSGVEVASGATLTVPTDGCLDVAGSLAVQGTGSISLGAAMNTGGTDVESAQLKFTGEYLGPPTLEMNGQLFKSAHTIGSPMKEGFVSSDLGDETKLIGWDAYTAGTYYSAGEAIATQGLGFYAIVGSNQFIAQAGGFDVIGSPMSSLDMSLGFVADNYSSTSAGSGWNMIANPYTCGWDWSASTLTNVATTFYIYDVSNSSWTFWNSLTGTGTGLTSAVIPPLQAIWVQATSAGATLSSTMDAAGELTCSGSSQNGFLKTANSIYKLTTVANGDSSDYSEMYLVDIAGATDGFDANYDAWHMNGHLSRGKLYNVLGAEEIVSNALEIDSSKVIDLAFDSDYLGTTYELNLTTSDADSTLKVVLEDRYEGTLWSMDNGAYTFVHTETPIGMKRTRFVLHYDQEASNVVGEDELDEQAGIAVAGTTITVSNPEAYGEYLVYDVSSRLLTKGTVIETITLPAEKWENGIYRLVFVGEQITTISIVVNK